jgi:hypothetical protein
LKTSLPTQAKFAVAFRLSNLPAGHQAWSETRAPCKLDQATNLGQNRATHRRRPSDEGGLTRGTSTNAKLTKSSKPKSRGSRCGELDEAAKQKDHDQKPVEVVDADVCVCLTVEPATSQAQLVGQRRSSFRRHGANTTNTKTEPKGKNEETRPNDPKTQNKAQNRPEAGTRNSREVSDV